MSEQFGELSNGGRHLKKGEAAAREMSADIFRIIACLVVVGNHCAFSASYECANALSRTFVSTLYSDGVSMFYFLAGFFSFYPKQKPYTVHLKGLLRRIVLPMFATLFVYILLGEYAAGEASVKGSITNGMHSLDTFALSIFYWDNKCKYSGHLWYLFVYSFLMLWYPFIAACIRYVMAEYRWRYYLAAIFALLVYNDITCNQLLGFAGHTFSGAASAFLFVIAGSIFWQRRELFKSKLFLVASPVLFVLVNVLRAIIQLQRWGAGVDNNFLLYYYSSFGLICVFLTAAFSVSLSNVVKSDAIKSFILKIAGLTFSVYLTHLMVRSFAASRGVFAKVAALLSIGETSTALSLFGYTTLCELIVFIACVCICAPPQFLSKRIKQAWRNSRAARSTEGQ